MSSRNHVILQMNGPNVTNAPQPNHVTLQMNGTSSNSQQTLVNANNDLYALARARRSRSNSNNDLYALARAPRVKPASVNSETTNNNYYRNNNNSNSNNIVGNPIGHPSVNPVANLGPVANVLGSGAYGCVLHPALANTNEHGASVEFPNNVTKIYTDKHHANKAVRNSAKLSQINARFGVPIHAYRKTLKRKNIPRSMQTRCHIRPGNNMNALVYPVRMPNLGKSVDDVIQNQHLIVSLRSINPNQLLLHISSLFETVDIYRKNKLIHGDIRTPNIMILPTGQMNIIDFDWLHEEKHFVSVYTGLGYYSNPLETCLWRRLYFSDAFRFQRSIFDSLLNEYTSSYNDASYPLWLSKPNDLYVSLVEIYEEFRVDNNEINDMTELFQLFRERSIPTFDSFGLAAALLKYMNVLFPEWCDATTDGFYRYLQTLPRSFGIHHSNIHRIVDLFQNVYDTVFIPMLHWNPKERMQIGEALVAFKQFIRDYNALIQN